MDRYQARNMLLLYDTIGQVASATGDAFNAHPALVQQQIVPRLLARLAACADDDKAMWPLTEVKNI